MDKEKTFWGIHAGKTGDAETLFEKKNVVAIGWEKMGDLSRFKTREDFKKRYEEVYPGCEARSDPGERRSALPLRPGNEDRRHRSFPAEKNRRDLAWARHG
jgi:hypothetical protein